MLKILFAVFLFLPIPQDFGSNQFLQATYEYLFDDAQKQQYNALPTNTDDQSAGDRYLENFWANQEDGKLLRELFLRRLDEVAEFIQVATFGDGWKTDRSKVYLFFGSPSELIRNSADPDQTLFEIWVYIATKDESKRCELKFEHDQESGMLRLVTQVEFPRSIQKSGSLPDLIKK